MGSWLDEEDEEEAEPLLEDKAAEGALLEDDDRDGEDIDCD